MINQIIQCSDKFAFRTSKISPIVTVLKQLFSYKTFSQKCDNNYVDSIFIYNCLKQIN